MDCSGLVTIRTVVVVFHLKHNLDVIHRLSRKHNKEGSLLWLYVSIFVRKSHQNGKIDNFLGVPLTNLRKTTFATDFSKPYSIKGPKR